jgi:uncharacterized protein YecT (DUF1311 family)
MLSPSIILVASALSTASPPAVASPTLCLDKYDATAQQIQCLNGQFSAAQRMMTGLLKSVSGNDKRVGAGVQKAQTIWEKFRETQCIAEGLQFSGGSLQPVTVQLCLVRLTNERIAGLHRLLKTLSPPPPP